MKKIIKALTGYPMPDSDTEELEICLLQDEFKCLTATKTLTSPELNGLELLVKIVWVVRKDTGRIMGWVLISPWDDFSLKYSIEQIFYRYLK